MHIIPGTPMPAPPRPMQLTIVFAELDGLAAKLSRSGRTLTIDPTCHEDDRVRVATDAIAYLLTGRSSTGYRPLSVRRGA